VAEAAAALHQIDFAGAPQRSVEYHGDKKMRNQIVAIVFFAIVCLALYGDGQQNQPAHHKALTPEQQANQQQYRQWEAHHRQLQVQGKQIFDAEMAREKAGDCPNAGTTYDFNICYGKQLNTTEANLKSLEETIRDLLAPATQMQGDPNTPPPGVASPSLTSAQLTAEFESVVRIWLQYRDTACTAAFHQFGDGSGGPSFEMQCRLQLARDHMRELRMIYGESFL
jgi:uncharacterized protein YecT (DUF1311 family)